MSKLILRLLACSVITLILPSPLIAARSNLIGAGIGVGLDLSERTNKDIVDDPETEQDESAQITGEDDYRRIVIAPLVYVTSTTQRDSFELRAAPQIKYDMLGYGTDWNSDFFIGGQRFITKEWEIQASNAFRIDDYYQTDSIATGSSATATTEQPSVSTDPELSSDIGRQRYWRNTLKLASDYTYRQDSLWGLDFDYIVLRYDDDERRRFDDYDRYLLGGRNEHRFNSEWSTELSLQFIRGDFEETDPEVAAAVIDELAPGSDFTPAEEDLSNDLQEYRLLASLVSSRYDRNPLRLTYNYIGARYDEPLQDDGDIHQARFTWERLYSEHLTSRLGLGPSYEMTEGQDANWGGNGVAELNYQGQRNSLRALLDKRYDVDNFSGTFRRGFVDSWNARLDYTHQPLKDLNLTAYLAYIYEDREQPIVGVSRVIDEGSAGQQITDSEFNELQKYHRDRYQAGIGINYNFLQNYSALISYIFTRQESDLAFDNYDENRLLLFISWQQDLLRW
ncbi:hypothetical protein ACFL0S_01490 [Thermodesulfobacteriota bacterium]